jgi:hypothetical protein
MPDELSPKQLFLKTRAQAYREVFLGHGRATDMVLADLAKFCRANTSTFHPDVRAAAALDGRREVFLRIAHHLNLTDEHLWALYQVQRLPDQPKEG